MAARPRFERRLPVKVGELSRLLRYHYSTAPYKCGFFLEESTKPTVAHIIFILGSHTFSKVYGAVALDSWPSEQYMATG